MTVLFTEGRTDAQASEAEKIMHLLTTVYPGHPWAVRVDQGIIFIRHLAWNGSMNYGMNLKTSEVDHDAAVMQKKIVMLMGEWLERAGLKRGRNNEDEIQHVEGIPEKHQPHQPLPDVWAIAQADPELRETPRPQVLRESEKALGD